MSRPFDPTLPFAALSTGRALELIAEMVDARLEKARQADVDGSRALSLIAAAKVAKRRQQVVREALISGALKGTNRSGKWFVAVGAVREWIAAGYPVKP